MIQRNQRISEFPPLKKPLQLPHRGTAQGILDFLATSIVYQKEANLLVYLTEFFFFLNSFSVQFPCLCVSVERIRRKKRK